MAPRRATRRLRARALVWALLVHLPLQFMGLAAFHARARAEITGTWQFTNYTTEQGLGSNSVRQVIAVGDTVYAATLFSGSGGGGLSISTDRGQTYTNRTTDNGLGSNRVSSVFVSGSTVYAATEPLSGVGGGLSISTDGGASFVTRTTADGLGNNRVLAVFASGSNVYAATIGGLSISTDGGVTFVNRTTADGLTSNRVDSVHAVGTTVYAGSTSGPLSISTDGGGTFTERTVEDGLGSNLGGTGPGAIYASGSSVWVATRPYPIDGVSTGGGVSISSNGGESFTNRTTADGLGSNTITGVFADEYSVYAAVAAAGGDNWGVGVSDDGGISFAMYPTESSVINGVFAAGRTIYAATNGGVSIGTYIVPEPSSAVLLGLGAALCGHRYWHGRRRSRRQSQHHRDA